MKKKGTFKVIILTIASMLAIQSCAIVMLCNFGVIHVGLGKETPASVQNVETTDTTTTTEPTTTTTTESTTETTEAATSSTKKKTTAKKTTTTTKSNNGGDNDGGWLNGWF